MVSLAKYIREHTGLDLSRKPGQQDVAAIDSALAQRPQVSGLLPPLPKPSPMQAIYDGVVGIDHSRHCGFDQPDNAPGPVRLTVANLATLQSLATDLRNKRGLESRKDALNDIACAAYKYSRLLEGKRDGLSKQYYDFGTRHTLVRGENGAIFEIVNSMSQGEVERFRRKTNMRINAVEKPCGIRQGAGPTETFYKVVLGAGSYGKARIARNIMRDEYVAVKKSHPLLIEDEDGDTTLMPAQASTYSSLSSFKKSVLKSISDAVIVPIDETKCTSSAADRLRHEVRVSLEDWRSSAETKSIYSFSELGMSSMSDACHTLAHLESCFESVTASSRLSEGACSLLQRYAEAYGRPELEWRPAQLAMLHRAKGMALFDLPDFKLKDGRHNQRYRNTLARDALIALAKLHGKQFVHNDVKPDNMVLAHEPDGQVRVKLIDIDAIEPALAADNMPEGGTPMFTPPEVHEAGYGAPCAFDAEKADSYAMGVVLRYLAGVNPRDVAMTAKFQMHVGELNRVQKAYIHNPDDELRAEAWRLQMTLDDIAGQADVRVRSRWEISQPQSLKDISDLMMQPDPDTRLTVRQVLNLPFFSAGNGFLNRDEFSKHAKLIVRFGSVMDVG